MADPEPRVTLADQLARAHDHVTTEIGRSDQKAAALVTALGIPLSVLVAIAPTRHSTVSAVLVGISAAGFVAAMMTALLALRPAFTRPPSPGSYLYWAACSEPEAVLDDLAADRRAAGLIRRAQIVRKKFRLLRRAVEITAGALLVLVVGLLVDLVE